MKKGLHPKYYPDCQVTCACGNTFVTGSTKPSIQVEICAQCHPFFTGKMKYVDTMGRVEKFQKLQKKAKKKGYQKKSDRQKQKAKQQDSRPATLKEMIQKERKKASAKGRSSSGRNQ